MLSQQEADELMEVEKNIEAKSSITFPMSDDYIYIEAKSINGHDTFLFDVNRKGKIKLRKCTYQERYAQRDILLRLDIDGPTHTNPDGEEVPCPHLHTYREGYGDKWATPLPPEFKNADNLSKTLRDFLKYANVTKIPHIQMSIE